MPQQQGQNTYPSPNIPLEAEQVVMQLAELVEDENYMLIYIDNIDFEDEFEAGKPKDDGALKSNKKKKEFHETVPISQTYYKVLRGQSTANNLLFCSFSDCL